MKLKDEWLTSELNVLIWIKKELKKNVNRLYILRNSDSINHELKSINIKYIMH